MIKRFLTLNTRLWKERRLKGTYLRYYIQNPDDERNIVARWLDFIGIIIITWALGFTLLAEITKIQKALLFSAVLMVICLIVIDILKRNQLKKKLLHTRRKLAEERYNAELDRMENSEFVQLVTNLLQKNGIKTNPDIKDLDSKNEMPAATFEERPVWIKFITGEMPAITSEIEEFLKGLTEKEYAAGLVISKEKASPELKQLIEPYREKIYIEILDKNRIARLASSIDHHSSSSLTDYFAELKQHQEKSKRKLFRKEILGTRQKTKGYALSAGLLFLLFALSPDTSALSILYLLFAVLNSALATTSLIMERQKKGIQLLKP